MILAILVDSQSTRIVNAVRYPSIGKDELKEIKRMAMSYMSGGGSRPDAFIISGETARKLPKEECAW